MSDVHFVPETILWRPVDSGLPDAEKNVLLFAEELGTFEGFLHGLDDSGAPDWRDVTALPVKGVTEWAEMPAGPGRNWAAGVAAREPALVPLANGRAVDLSGAVGAAA